MDGSNNDELAAMRRRRDAIRLAGEGMLDVIETAELLRYWPVGDGDDVDRIRRVIETGMFVVYARPFTGSPLHVERARALTARQLELHQELIDLRHNVYAHSNVTPYREVVDNETSPDGWDLRWLYPTPVLLDEVIDLARTQLASFLTALEKADERLAEAEAA